MDISDVLRRLRPILGEDEVRRQWEALQLVDAKTAKLLEYDLRRQLADATGTTFDDREILFEPIPKERAGGEIRLGTVCYGSRELYPFGINRSEIMQHLAIFGRSGAGKTNVVCVLLSELVRLKVPFVITDWKGSFRDLIALPQFRDLVVYTVGRDPAPFLFNPLIPPPSLEPREWIKKVGDLIARVLWLGDGCIYLLQEELNALYEEFGVYDGEPSAWPTFRDLQARLRRRPVKGREAQWLESLLRALGVICFGGIDAVVNSGPTVSLRRMLGQHAVLELSALGEAEKELIVDFLLLWMYHLRMSEGRREELKHVVIIEEAHHVLLAKAAGTAASPIEVIFRMAREGGTGLAAIDQQPGSLSRAALENTYMTVVMNLKEQRDVTAAARSMLLSADETKNLGRLPVGFGIVKMQSRWVSPFLVRFPHFRVDKGSVTNQQVHARFLESIDVAFAGTVLKQSWDAVMRLVPARWLAPAANPSSSAPDQPPVDALDRALLQDVADHPLSKVTERYARLGLTADKGTQLVSRLLDRAALKKHVIRVERSNVRLLELTEAGRSALGLPETETDRHGGVVHQFWVERIAGQLSKKGWQAETEAALGGGKTVDVLASAQGRRVAVEVETGASDWRSNIEKLRGMVALLVIACANKELALRIESAILVADQGWVIVSSADGAADLISKNQ